MWKHKGSQITKKSQGWGSKTKTKQYKTTSKVMVGVKHLGIKILKYVLFPQENIYKYY